MFVWTHNSEFKMLVSVNLFTVHVGSVRQTATIIKMTEAHLRTGDKALVRFRFIKNPEYLKTNMRLVFREGRTKAVGTITNLYPHVSAVAQNTRQQRAAKKAQQESKHHVNPQNEPQKPSKRNRRSRRTGGNDYSKDNAYAGSPSSGGATAAHTPTSPEPNTSQGAASIPKPAAATVKS